MFEVLRKAIEELADLDLSSLTGRELSGGVVECSRLLGELSAQLTRLVGEADRRNVHGADGFVSATSWLRHVTGVASGVAGRRIKNARFVGEYPRIDEMYSAGRVVEDRLAALADLAADFPESFPDSAEMLAGFAESLGPRSFRRAVGYWRHLAMEHAASSPDGLFEKRWLRLSPTYSGMVRVDGQLDPESGAVVLEALAAATTESDRSSVSAHTAEPARARRVDGLVEICRRFLDQGTVVEGGERPHLNVIVDLRALQGSGVADFERGGVIRAEAARRLACDCGVSRVIVAGESEPLDVGRRTRTIPSAIRRALVIRDGGCRFPGCDRPPVWCDAHHIRHWVNGGETSLSNLVLLCRRHHRMVHEGGYRVEIDGSRVVFTDSHHRVLPGSVPQGRSESGRIEAFVAGQVAEWRYTGMGPPDG